MSKKPVEESTDSSQQDTAEQSSEPCQHGWNGEGYDIRESDSMEVVHEKNNYNAAVESAFGGEPSEPTAVAFAAQSFMNARTFSTAPQKIEEGCDCDAKDEKSTSDYPEAGKITRAAASVVSILINEAEEVIGGSSNDDSSDDHSTDDNESGSSCVIC
jgi:hypothetical protein